LLAERGTEGISLREVARRSGVSPAAPAHHFGDAAGLLTAVTTLAFDGLTAALQAGNERGGSDPVARLREQGIGYVEFALRYPGRFGLMFRCLPDEAGEARQQDAALARSARMAFTVLEDGVRALLGVPPAAPLSAAHWQAILGTWSLVHGFAHLALAGQFNQVLQAMAPAGRGAGRASERHARLHQVLAPLLERHLHGLAVLRERADGP
jgi:AcrR family transcriptional regulator